VRPADEAESKTTPRRGAKAVELKVIPTERLAVDPDVQMEFAIEERRWRRMATNWNHEAVGILIVVPNGSGYYIVDGRHRYLGGSLVGVKTWRCDVHREATTPAEKAQLKLAYDRDRRHVGAFEHWSVRRIAGDPVVRDASEIIEAAGFLLGKQAPKRPNHYVGAVTSVERIYNELGRDKFQRVFELAKIWQGDPQSTSADWLMALGLLVRDDYDKALTAQAVAALEKVIPAALLRRARGEHIGSRGETKLIAYSTAVLLRKAARLKIRPAQKPAGGNRGKELR